MIDDEIDIVFYELIFKSNEISKYLRHMYADPSNFYLDEILGYSEGFEEALNIIRDYIIDLKIKNLENGG